MRRLALAALLLPLAGAAALAQVTINAEVSQTDVAAGDQVTLAVTVSGPDASLPEPRIPPLADLSVYDSGRSQNLSIVNGRVSSSIVYTFVAIPRKVGTVTIPPIGVSYKGTTAQTAPITLNVRKPGASAAAAPRAAPRAAPQLPGMERGSRAQAPDAFITAELDKKTAYVNEQLTLTVRFYTGVELLQGPQYTAPALSGFLAEDLPPERHGNQTVRGRPYYYWEIKTALFPAQPGRLTIGPATARVVMMPSAAELTPDSLFDRFFQQGIPGRVAELRSDPLALNAQPLPDAGKPAGFSGSVGQFTISAAVDRPRAKAGEALNLTVTVTGQGNLKTIGAPVMPDMPALRVFDSVSSLNLDKRGDVVRGSKVFKTVLVPRASGKQTIPPIAFDYFDPAQRAYRRAQTAPIALDIQPGDAGAASAAGPSAAPRGVTAVSRDLRYLEVSPRRGRATAALEALAAAGAANAAPFAAFLAALGLSGYRRRALLDPAGARARAAQRSAQAKLKLAREARAPDEATARLSEALLGYLGDRLGQPASGLTLKRALELLRRRRPDAPAELVEQVKELWEEVDMRRFAPAASGADPHPIAERIEALLARLESEVFA